ncbi:arylsulphatase A [Lentisphaera araneosa HTCC2155]|uniref:Arylsulphatase A n=1 Tax=Lentisphaera araneosa HTCC2155 TaxID=313628 RepID=A6DJ59_9BACT|nr:sulfatase-like hydrolase/transferase [Lentisphaera araneosa]EDM28495.1 arylsulphatase A [Lentisphaera araneosa HTCC2155]
MLKFILISFFSVFALSAKTPNIVILLADDLGYKDIACYKGPVETPNIDSLAVKGTKFETFYSGSAVCSPSRATLITGRHHIRTGIYSWVHDATQKTHLLEREITLAEMLKEKGYMTAHFGKWHLGMTGKKAKKPNPDAHGFDYWFATGNNAAPSHKNPNNFVRNGKEVGPLEGYSAQLVVDDAINWLDKREDTESPFFMNVWFHEPHKKMAAPEDIIKKYKDQKKSKNEDLYSATIDNTDQAVGRLLNKLAEVAKPEDTLIIYSSDNGSFLSERTEPFLGNKGSNYQGGLRVPGIISWPGHVKESQVVQETAALVDIMPTLRAIVENPNPSGLHLDGTDLSPLLFAEPAKFERQQALFWHLHKAKAIVAMRQGKYMIHAAPDYDMKKANLFDEKLIPIVKSGKYKDFELFDLELDPGQEKNIASQNPELTQKLIKQLYQINDSIMADGTDWHLK